MPLVPCSTIRPLLRKPLTSHSSTRTAKSSSPRIQRLSNRSVLCCSLRLPPHFQQYLLWAPTVAPHLPQLVSAAEAGSPHALQYLAAFGTLALHSGFVHLFEKIPIV